MHAHASTQGGHKRNLEHTMKPRQCTVNNKGRRRRSANERTWKCTQFCDFDVAFDWAKNDRKIRGYGLDVVRSAHAVHRFPKGEDGVRLLMISPSVKHGGRPGAAPNTDTP